MASVAPHTLPALSTRPRDVEALAASAMSSRQWWVLALLGVGVLGLASLLLRPLLPVDETRYISVGWEMWHRGQFLVPQLNGELYDHKPPVLFWLMHAGWSVFGVNQWWPRLLGPLSTLLSLWALARIGARLWPDRPGIGRLGSLMFLGSWYIAFYQTALMFDMPLLACIALGWLALLTAAGSGALRHWLGFGAALGAALLVKGPVALVYLLPAVVAMRWWAPVDAPKLPGWRVVAAFALALALPSAWLAAASLQGSEDYFSKLLVDQTVNRVNGEMGHPRPWHWYLPMLLLLLLPWTLWWPAWKGLWRAVSNRRDRGNRFLLVGLVAGLVALSAVGGKQAHYLIPLLALTAMAIARGLHDLRMANPMRYAVLPGLVMSPLFLFGLLGLARAGGIDLQPWLPEFPLWGPFVLGLITLALMLADARNVLEASRHLLWASLGFCAVILVILFVAVRPRYDLETAGRYLGEQQRAGRDAIYVGNYQGEFGYFGRLQDPVRELSPAEAQRWARRNPEGLVISRLKRLDLRGGMTLEFRQPYKTDELLMFRAADLDATGSHLRDPQANTY